jgi:uncharacterized NAD(P)/FAD-binding protein YdhS
MTAEHLRFTWSMVQRQKNFLVRLLPYPHGILHRVCARRSAGSRRAADEGVLKVGFGCAFFSAAVGNGPAMLGVIGEPAIWE